jgi:hypothetical protein
LASRSICSTSTVPRGSHSGRPGSDVVVEHEEVELGPELAVVAPPRLLELPQVLLELLGARERHAVHPLHHRPLLVAAPVRAGDAHELEVRRDVAGGRHVRTAAQVGEAAAAPLLVEAERDVLGQVLDQLDLVRVALRAPVGERVGPRHLEAAQRQLRRHDRAHALLERLQVVGGQRRGRSKS